MYVWSDEEQEHQMDFIASKKLDWDQHYKLVVEGVRTKPLTS
jgi:hypothetical protein